MPPFDKLLIENKTYVLCNEQTLKQKQLFMIGREDAFKRVQALIDRFLKGVERKAFVTVRGTYGIGKSLFLRKILYRIHEKITSNQYATDWKYGERARILLQSVGPISKSQKMCGFRTPLNGFFRAIAKRLNATPDMALLCRLAQLTPENQEAHELVQEVLGLREVDVIANFPPPPRPEGPKKAKLFDQQVKHIVHNVHP